jgi:hypothetical protein
MIVRFSAYRHAQNCCVCAAPIRTFLDGLAKSDTYKSCCCSRPRRTGNRRRYFKTHRSNWPVETADLQAPLPVASPESTPQALEVIKSCGQMAVSVVPQDERTGLAGGAVPSARCIILSLKKCYAPRRSTPLQRQ